jgi:heterodisulfide reductase subunit C
MGYKTPKIAKTLVNGVAKEYGETIEEKVERVVNNGEPIEDGAPNVYTERKHGLMAEHDIRTDRWEVATDAMDAVQKSTKAQREKKGITKDNIVTDDVESNEQGKVSNGE